MLSVQCVKEQPLDALYELTVQYSVKGINYVNSILMLYDTDMGGFIAMILNKVYDICIKPSISEYHICIS